MIRKFVALGVACALACLPMSASAQQTDDQAYNTAGTYRGTVPTEALNPTCNGGLPGVVGKTYGGTVCPTPGAPSAIVIPVGTGALTTIGTPATNGSPLAAGGTGTRIYLGTSDSLTYTVEAPATCGASAPAAAITRAGPADIQEALAGVIVCVTAKSGSPSSRAY